MKTPLRKKAWRRLRLARKEFDHWVRPHRGDPAVLFIIGCQRSGTTMVLHILERDRHAQIFREHSRLSNQDTLDGLRLNPLPEVKAIISRSRFPLVVLKPLVETQNARRLLEAFPEARALWMYRDYRDVALSNLRAFGPNNGIKNLRFLGQGDTSNWRAENVPPDVRDLICAHFSEEMDRFDAAALFWYLRNQFFFSLELDRHPRVMMCRYSDLVADPPAAVSALYRFVGRPYPGDDVVSAVHAASVGKGEDVPLSPDVEALCADMLARLDAAYYERA